MGAVGGHKMDGLQWDDRQIMGSDFDIWDPIYQAKLNTTNTMMLKRGSTFKSDIVVEFNKKTLDGLKTNFILYETTQWNATKFPGVFDDWNFRPRFYDNLV